MTANQSINLSLSLNLFLSLPLSSLSVSLFHTHISIFAYLFVYLPDYNLFINQHILIEMKILTGTSEQEHM